MTTTTEDKLRQYLKRVTVDLGHARQQLRDTEQRLHEPIAITSMACHYPGDTNTPNDLWNLTTNHQDATTSFPTNRGWNLQNLHHPDPDHPGTTYTLTGGFLHNADLFDAGFFNISPREALAMDPQQRLLLDTCWELLENAHINPTTLKGTPTAVYTGCGVPGFGTPHVEKSAEGFLLTGNALSVVSGRIAFTLGLEGPAVTLDTACSSSLVAMHLAVQALRQGECNLAIAGGVTVMSTPNVITEFSRQRGLAPDGRCKPFASAADGTGFSEGAGLLLLERLSDAQRNGRQILAVIRGSAVNQDGASNGLSAPNGPAQQRVIRKALANAGLAAAEVDAVEAHGTGTRLGDPIEAEALIATYGKDRPADQPLWLGSVKSNIGHTQGAAGVAGVIKMVMALQHGKLPATIHVDEPSSHVDWSAGTVRVLTEDVDWPAGDRPRRAGVSAFGISGTNAHVILEEAPAPSAPEEQPAPVTGSDTAACLGGVTPWVLSARTEAALTEQAGRLAEALTAAPDVSDTEVSWSLATTRAVFEHRAVVVGEDREQLLAGLGALASGDQNPDVVRATVGDVGHGPVFVFPGQGSQWIGMGVELLDSSPVFAARITECEKALAPHVDWSLTAVLRGTDTTTDPARVDVIQPALWAIMVSLASVWESFGIRPAAVIGHSQGEIAAACAAGALTIDDAARVVALRSQALRALAGHGTMASLNLTADDTTALIAELGAAVDGVAIAASNGPTSTVVSGPVDQVHTLVNTCQEQGGRARVIDVDYASHGPQVDRIKDDLARLLHGIKPQHTDTAFYSAVTGQRIDTTGLDADYWFTNLRQPVRFTTTVKALLADGHRVFIETSPHPVLTPGMQETFEEAGTPAVTVATLRRDQGGAHQLALALAQAHTTGVTVDWQPWHPTEPAPGTVALPTYAFQGQRYWMAGKQQAGDVGAAGLRPVAHPLLSAAVGLADGALLLSGRLPTAGNAGWLAEHEVAGTVILPGAALVEWALRMADEADAAEVESLTLHVPLALSHSTELRLQVVADAPDESGRRDLHIYSRPALDAPETSGSWTCHATGTLTPDAGAATGLAGQWPPADAEPLDVGDLYERAAAAGYRYGPSFQGVRAAWRQGSDLLAEITLPDGGGEDADTFGIHPALLDAALHPAVLNDGADASPADGRLWLPFSWTGVALHAQGATSVRVRLSPRTEEGTDRRELGVVLADPAGAPVLGVESIVMRPADGDQLGAARRESADGLFTVEWAALPAVEDVPALEGDDDRWALLGTGPWPAASPLTRHADPVALVAAVDGGATVPSVVLAAVPRSTGDDAETGCATVLHVLELVRTWLAEPALLDSRLVLVTSGAVSVADAEAADPAAAAVWGLVRGVQTEHPDRFTLVDIEAGTEADGKLADAVRRAVAADEPQFAVRGGAVSIPRLVRVTAVPEAAAEDDAPQTPSLADGTVVVSGGTGVLGGVVAEHLVRTHGVTRLLLLSRSGPEASGAVELVERLAELGAQAEVAAVDVADREALARTLADVPTDHPVVGVLHAAGVVDDGLVETWDPDRLHRVWGPKATGAWNLHTLTADLPLRMFTVFSSAAGVIGNAGQAGYAAANAWTDALTAHRRTLGRPGTSIAWSLWEQTSAMTQHLTAADLARLGNLGMRPLSTPRALGLLDAATRLDRPLTLAADLHPTRSDADGGASLPAMLRGLVRQGRRRAAAGQSGGPAFTARLAGLDAAGRLGLLLETVRSTAATVLGHHTADTIRAEAPFKELGFDSLTAVELRNRLTGATGLRLPATLVFDYPTPHVLATHLLDRLTGTGAAITPAAARAAGRAGAGQADDPIVVVAMACRFPGGVNTPEELWELVASGGEALGPFPENRGWDLEGLFHPDPENLGTSYATQGAFLYDADEFDAGFFNINPREALATDPQQRLMLETAWQLLERAGIDPHTLKDSLTGVYTGVMYHEYATGLGAADPRLDGYGLLSGSGSVVAGRISYTLGLQGPAMTVDTACSSSLVAMHLAAQALRNGECDLALAGGVTVMASPDVFTGFSRQRGLAPDGRCKPFAAAADGTGWGEGAALLLMERQSDAERNGHQIVAVLKGSAVNQDGASNGLTAPNGPSQQRVIRQALASAGITAADVDAVEAHGTGTTLGDPIEAQALLATYGTDRPDDQPLWLGSIKSNIGHTQAAAGAAGVIKMIMAMQHGHLPASLHIDEPTPHVDWTAGAVQLLTEHTPWPTVDRPRRVGVSSFGASGTNSHLILEQAPERTRPAAEETEPVADDGTVVPLVLSARSAEALRGQAAKLADLLTGDAVPSVGAVGRSLVTSRSVFEKRAVALGSDRDELLGALTALAAGQPHTALVEAAAADSEVSGRTVWLFSGQGSQRPGMGAELHARFPVYAAAFDEVCELLNPHLEHPLQDVVFGNDTDLIHHTTYAQTGLFALQISLARLLDSMGVTPDTVIGHSVGEIAAAHTAGVLDLADACRLVATRATLMGSLPTGTGAMTAIEATPDELEADLGEYNGQVSIAALNSPTSTVISGTAAAVQAVATSWQERGRRIKALTVSHAFHSAHMDPILSEFTAAISGLTFHQPRIPLISNLTGEAADANITTPDYWAQHIRQPVRFHPAVALASADAGIFLEIGPGAALTSAAQHTLDITDRNTVVLSTLAGKQPDAQALARTLARLHTHTPVDWTSWLPAAKTVDLPTYAFQRGRYWIAPASGTGISTTGHPHLTTATHTPDGTLHHTGLLPTSTHDSWLTQHTISNTTLLPGTALLQWALHTADQTDSTVNELLLQQPLVLSPTHKTQLHLTTTPADTTDQRTLTIHTRPHNPNGNSGEWICHATATLTPHTDTTHQADTTTWPPQGAHPVDTTGFYDNAATHGYHYGPTYQALHTMWRHGDQLLAEITLPTADGTDDSDTLTVHPALLDAALHPLIHHALDTADESESRQLWLPFAWTDTTLHATGVTHARVRITPADAGSPTERRHDVTLTDTAGNLILTTTLATRPVTAAQLQAAQQQHTNGLFALEWAPVSPAASPATAGRTAEWAVLGGDLLPGAGAVALPDLDALRAAVGGGSAVPSVVLTAVTGADRGEDAVGGGLETVQETLALVRQWLAEPLFADARLAVVTRNAVAEAAGGAGPDPVGAAVWGLLRSAQTENPGRFVLVDAADDAGLADAVCHAVDADEPQVAVRDGRVIVPRLVRASAANALVPPVGRPAWRLDTAGTATIDSVAAVPFPEALEPLKAGQVRIGVRAGGVNFRDVLISLGMVPGQTGLGGEGAGVVLDVAADVTRLSPGDRVMGVFEGAFGQVTVADARMVAPMPEGWSFAQAAAVPVAFLTAWYGLVELGGLRAGETVLVHAATGGVGTAAVQIARHLGATVYATASPAKHHVLEAMGIDEAHRASSRDLDFEDTFRTATDGAGFDVVLNSLAGAFTDASLRLLTAEGRFLEMGKTDIREPKQVAEDFPGIDYRVYDLVTDAGAERIGRMLAALGKLFAEGVLLPPPVQTWPLAEARQALRHMSQARHTGKLVLEIPPALDPAGTVLVTGGTGTLGGLVAEHLVARLRRPAPAAAQPPRARRTRRGRTDRPAAGPRRHGADHRRRHRRPRRARRGAGGHRPGAPADRCRAHRGHRRRRGPRLADAGPGAPGCCGREGRDRRQPAPGDGGSADLAAVRDVLVGGRHPRQPRPGQLRGGQRLLRRARRAPPSRRAVRRLHRLGPVGRDQRHDRPPGGQRPGPDEPHRRQRAGHRARPGPVRRGVPARPAGSGGDRPGRRRAGGPARPRPARRVAHPRHPHRRPGAACRDGRAAARRLDAPARRAARGGAAADAADPGAHPRRVGARARRSGGGPGGRRRSRTSASTR